MKQAEKLEKISHIAARLLKVGDYDTNPGTIFRASRAMLAASIAGSQRRRKSQAELDAIYARAFPAMLRAIK